jgi:hypothetical protein
VIISFFELSAALLILFKGSTFGFDFDLKSNIDNDFVVIPESAADFFTRFYVLIECFD